MKMRQFLALALLLIALVPAIGWATGTLSIPNVIGAQSGPNIAASLFDTNWNTIRDYINNREITLDVLASRPAAGTAGRLYFTTDAGTIGQLYADTGSAWMPVGIATSTGVNQVKNLTANDASTTTYALTADQVQVRNPQSGAVITLVATSTLTNNTATVGPAANGRDRSSNFSDSDRFIHLYYIYNGSTLATISSTCSTTNSAGGTCGTYGGPNLPSGYTHWAYAASVPWTVGGFIPTYVRGNNVCYSIASRALSNGAATGETAVSVASQVSSNALTWSANIFQTAGTPMHFRVITGREFFGPDPFAPPGGRAWQMTFPHIARQFYYFGDANPGVYVDVTCYTVPNGS